MTRRWWFTPRQWHPATLLPNISYLSLAVLVHLGLAWRQFFRPHDFAGPTYHALYQLAPIRVWAALSLATGIMMLVGFWRSHQLLVVGLMSGFVVCLSRGLLIELAPDSAGAGILVWAAVAFGHWSQLGVQTRMPG